MRGGVADEVRLTGARLPLRRTWSELWSHRELAYFLAWRDVKVRYKQAVLGVGWAIIRPLLMMAIFTLVFGRLVGVDTGGVPYAAFALVGLVIWTYFSTAVVAASDSLVNNSNLLSKVYFPRLALPVGALLAQVPDLLVGTVLVAIVLAVLGVAPAATVALVPVVLVLAVLSAMSVAVWLSALNVSYRDVKHVVPFLVQVWLFATPVVYPATLVPEAFRVLYALNPAAAPVELARWAVLGIEPPSWGIVGASVGTSIVLLLVGTTYFRRMENRFADVI